MACLKRVTWVLMSCSSGMVLRRLVVGSASYRNWEQLAVFLWELLFKSASELTVLWLKGGGVRENELN